MLYGYRSPASTARLVQLGLVTNAIISGAVVFVILQWLGRGAGSPAGLSRLGELEGMHELVFLVTAMVFIAWTHRSYANLKHLGAEWPRFRTTWAIGSWFVPLLNLWRPKQVLNDVWRASDPDLPASQRGLWHGRRVPVLFALWWLTFVVGAVITWIPVLSVIVFFALIGRGLAGASASDPTYYAVVAVGQALLVVSAILGLYVVQATTRRQEARFGRLTSAQRSLA